ARGAGGNAMDVDTRLRAARRSHADVKPPWRPSPKAGGGNEYPPSSRVTSAVSPRIQHDDFWRNTPSPRQAARSDAARHIKILAPRLQEAVGPAPRRLCGGANDTDAGEPDLPAVGVAGQHKMGACGQVGKPDGIVCEHDRRALG